MLLIQYLQLLIHIVGVFQSISCNVGFGVKEGTNPKLLNKRQDAAERSCIVQQTLRMPPPVVTTFEKS